MDDPTCVSLFSGIGGLDLGLHRAGFRHLAFCESDAYRRDVLQARWSGVPVHDDVGTFPGSREERRSVDAVAGRGGTDASEATELRVVRGGEPDVAERSATVDLLCGGFPCQDLSVAGQRRGLDGNRSGLFFEFARIAESLRPRWVLVENVPGLLSSNGGRDFGTVLGTLADIGYGVAWRVLDSRFFGVPQRRRRVFILGALADGDPRAAAERAGQVLAVGTRCPGHPATSGEAREDLAAAPLSGPLGGGNDGIGRRTEDDPNLVTMPIAPTLSTKNEVASSSTQRWKWMDQSAALFGAVRRLTPTECERLQALPDGWTQLGRTPDSKRYAAVGDAVTATVAEWIGRRLIAA